MLNRTFSCAPMMDWSDRHCRYLWRQMSERTLLYTEMVTTGALIHGDTARFLDFNSEEHPVALQLGGSNPDDLARCCELAEQWGYDEINLNCGCPSDRVQNGMIGAILMKHPQLVADCFKAMQAATDREVTIKHRIGVDDTEDYAYLAQFVETIAAAGCKVFIVHARKAWLKGLSPKENREIPPLQYPLVYQLKEDFPELTIVINGGIETLADCETHLAKLDGVMVGREAYTNPYLLAEVDQQLFGLDQPILTRKQVAARYIDYCRRQVDNGQPLYQVARHMLGLFHGLPGGRKFRRHLSENGHKPGASAALLEEAVDLVRSD